MTDTNNTKQGTAIGWTVRQNRKGTKILVENTHGKIDFTTIDLSFLIRGQTEGQKVTVVVPVNSWRKKAVKAHAPKPKAPTATPKKKAVATLPPAAASAE